MSDTPALAIVFFGSPAFAVPTLERLLASPHRVVGVVTQPDRPRGRGQRVTRGSVSELARAAGLPVLQPTRLRDEAFLEALAALKGNLGVVAAYGRLLPPDVLSCPRLGLINVHASLLPRYRGAAPIHRAVMAGETVTGVTIMRVVEALDAGPMLASIEHPIGVEDTSADVERSLAQVGADLLVRVVGRLAAGAVPEVPQDDALATYAPRITRDDGLIDWSLPASRVHNLVRGLYPWPHAFTYLAGRRYLLLKTVPPADTPVTPTCRPGMILEASGDSLRICAGDGRALAVLELQIEGRRSMGVRNFLSGHPLEPGTTFESPAMSRGTAS